MHCDDTIYKRKLRRLLKCGSANRGDCTKQAILLNGISENTFLRRSLATEQLLEAIKEGKLFGYVQCDIEVPEKLRENFAYFPPLNIQKHFF